MPELFMPSLDSASNAIFNLSILQVGKGALAPLMWSATDVRAVVPVKWD